MLAMATTSTSSSRRRRRAAGDAWRRLSPVVAQIPLDFRALGSRKSQQRMPQSRRSVDSFAAELGDEEVQEDHAKLLTRGVFAACRDVAFSDSDEDSESDYVPSEQDDGEDDMSSGDEGDEDSAAALFARYDNPSDVDDDDDDDVAVDDDRRWWRSREDKRRWRERYQASDAAFRRHFGCSIDSPALPETRRRLRHEKTRHCTYTLVLGALVVAYLAQLVAVYSASSWAFSMVTWQSSTPPNSKNGSVVKPDSGSSSSSIQAAKTEDLGRSKQREIPEHVLTGLHLCATLSRRVVKSQHDVTATQHALRACEIAVKFAPHASREAVEAHVLRGDLRSLLSRFDGANEDYQAALNELQDIASSGGDVMLSPGLRQHLEHKVIANHWSQLYKAKKFKDLRREAKAQAETNDGHEDDATLAKALRELANDWLHVFKREKSVLGVLTRQRGWTLRRLTYEIGDEEKEAETET